MISTPRATRDSIKVPVDPLSFKMCIIKFLYILLYYPLYIQVILNKPRVLAKRNFTDYL